jgi:rhodanese-related sulfurtransferase
MTALAVAERSTSIRWETSQFSGSTRAAPTATTGVSPRAAYQLLLYGRAVLVDIRPDAERRAEGEVDPALRPLVMERDGLERRLDPRSRERLPWARPDIRLLVLDREGYASSLAAASLVRLGLTRAAGVVGGLRAWREAGLPLAERAAA